MQHLTRHVVRTQRHTSLQRTHALMQRCQRTRHVQHVGDDSAPHDGVHAVVASRRRRGARVRVRVPRQNLPSIKLVTNSVPRTQAQDKIKKPE